MQILYSLKSAGFTEKGVKKNTQKNKSYIKESVYFSTKNVQKNGELFM